MAVIDSAQQLERAEELARMALDHDLGTQGEQTQAIASALSESYASGKRDGLLEAADALSRRTSMYLPEGVSIMKWIRDRALDM